MRDWVRKTETAANIAIIVVSILIAGLVVKSYLARPGRGGQNLPTGTRLSPPNVDWSKRDRTLVMALQEECSYCSESAPFYQRLARETRSNGRVGLVAVLPQEPSRARDYLHRLGVEVDEVRQLPLRSISWRRARRQLPPRYSRILPRTSGCR